ncbi:MAG: AraC family transcriptional regulator [Prevotella sp.]|nr:AraC family transcriptional regulator [Prevotella sp.]
MKKSLFAIVITIFAIGCENAPRRSVKTDGPLSDSTTLQIEKIAEADTTRAFCMLDSLYKKGELAEHTYYHTRARIYQGTVDRLLAIGEVRRAYETTYVQQHDTIRAQVLQWMTRLMLPVGNHEECISQAVEGIQLARQLNDPVMEADFMMIIGMSYYDMGDKPHAWERMDASMERVRAIDSKQLKDADRTKLATMALTVATAHVNDQDMEGGIASCRTTFAVLDTASPPTSLSKGRGGSADMLRGQAYAMMAGAFAKLSMRDSADHYAKLYWQTPYGQQNKGQRLKTYFKFSGRYEEGLKVTEDYLARCREQADTINRQYVSLLHEAEDYNVAMGRYQEAYRSSRRATVLTDSLHARDMRLKAMEYAEKFESQEKDHVITVQQRGAVILCVVVGFTLVVLAILIFFIHRIQGKNRDLQNVISSLEQKQKIVEHFTPVAPVQPQDQQDDSSATETDDLNFQEYLKMERIINEQKVFLNPMANIDTVMEQAGYSRRKSTQLIQQFACTNTRVDYLNQKRVEYAAHLLLADRSLLSKDVGTRSGFYEDSTFRRNFKKYYGVTPAAYRAMHAE